MKTQIKKVNIIGLDAAVQEKNIGCVFGTFDNETFTVTARWTGKEPLPTTLARWIRNSEQVILAIDAPLGWPVSFRRTLDIHIAGKSLDIDPELFFKRKTDLDIRQRFNKTTLEITADRIARTAFFTLQKIGNIEKLLKDELKLLWTAQELKKYGIIEVYPAATLLANGFSIKGYKKKNTITRKDLYRKLQARYSFTNPEQLDLTTVEHDFDAFICCLACMDFIHEKAVAPKDFNSEIKEEGWIWVKHL